MWSIRGDEASEMGAYLPYVDIGTSVLAMQIQCGAKHCCVLTGEGFVKCWGDGGNGRLVLIFFMF